MVSYVAGDKKDENLQPLLGSHHKWHYPAFATSVREGW
jgi:hypothetical protein